MSRYSESWGFRAPLTVDGSANTTNAKDVTFTVPVDWDEFWDSVEATGADIRVTSADGVTLIGVIYLTTWVYATRTAVISFKLVDTTTDNVMHALWLYWGNAAATTVSSVFTPASPLTASAWMARPAGLIVTCQGQRPGDTKPRAALMKSAAEVDFIFWNFRPRLLGRTQPYSGSSEYEEIAYILVAQLETTIAGAVAGTYSLASCRVIDGGVAMFVQAGTSGTTYTAVCKVVTTLGRTLEERALLKVRNVTE